MAYLSLFYKCRRDAAGRSARGLMPLLLDLIRPQSVIDVGCGDGTWLDAARQAGVADVTGIDGPWVRSRDLVIPEADFHRADLTKPWRDLESAGMVMSLEVAEHLPRDSAQAFVENLTALAPVVVFSAAIPGQGGHLHINEQWPSWWIPFFAERGFELYDVVRPMIWENEAISYWYRQNVLVFARPDAPAETLERLRAARTRGDFRGADLVHPEHSARSLQYPSLVDVLKAVPVAAVRSAAASGTRLHEFLTSLRPAASPAASQFRTRVFALGAGALLLAGAGTATLVATGQSSRSDQRDLVAWYEANRISHRSELFYLNDIPHEEVLYERTVATAVDEENLRAIEQELNDGHEDFFAVEDSDLDDFTVASRLDRVGQFGDFILFRDSGSASVVAGRAPA